MMKANKGKTLMMMAVLMLSLAFSGFAHAAALKTMKSDSGMELFHLRQASEMYGYSIEWNDLERSVTLVYMDKMDDSMMGDDTMMKDDKMMDDGSMMKDDKMLMPAGKMIKLWIDSKEIMIDGMKVTLDTAPAIYDGSTYVVEALITQYMKPAMAMN
ncbi:stalk domain-containing protein [Paenibacillus mesotrionivorans]|uniref:Stalk domain-containing protein n=1 Tax=Paenibacillus mesotrionivorans TaxID=3160968 RepID=A0ACC7NYN2_9BACL